MEEFMFSENFSLFELETILNETTSDRRWFAPETEVALVLAYALLITFGLLLNATICYVVLKKKTMRTARNLFILNLAVSDIVMCVFCMPFTLVKLLMKDWVLGDVVCRTVPWLQATNVFVSTITITAIALDRYHVILYPCAVKERLQTWGVLASIAVIWVLSGAVGIPLVVYSRVVTERYLMSVQFTYCVEEWPSYKSKYTYAVSVLVLQFVLPITILFILHWKIADFLKSRINKNPCTHFEVSRAIKEARRHRKNALLLMAIAVMFAVCWFPLTVLNFLADFNYRMITHQHFLLAFACSHLIAMSSAIANPILYGWFNSNFKREFVQIWGRSSGRSSDDPANPILGSDPPDPQHPGAGGGSPLYRHQTSYKAIQPDWRPSAAIAHRESATEEVKVDSG